MSQQLSAGAPVGQIGRENLGPDPASGELGGQDFQFLDTAGDEDDAVAPMGQFTGYGLADAR